MNYVMSLKRTPERLEKFLNNNRHMDFQIFDAVDGKDLEPLNGYTKYAHALALSHIELWKRCAAGTEDFLICEDDAELHKDFPRVLDTLKNGHPYEFIAWGWNFDAELLVSFFPELSPVSMHFSQDHMRQNKDAYLSTPTDPIFMRLHNLFGSCCYTISPEGAKKFLEILYPLQKTITVDIPNVRTWTFEARGFDCVMAAAFAKTISVVTVPPLALTYNDHSASTIQNIKD
jgi:glycosyl transferase, family 25